jgi:hypothetical protein
LLRNQLSGETTSEIPPASYDPSEKGNTKLKNPRTDSPISCPTKRGSIHHHIASHTNLEKRQGH